MVKARVDLFLMYGRREGHDWTFPLCMGGKEARSWLHIFLVYGIERGTVLDIFLELGEIEGMERLFLVYVGDRGQWRP